VKKSQIIIGTASWGSKINFNKALEIGNSIVSIGLNHFDSAPNYGSGYSHHILNKLGKEKDIFVDTKYGQDIVLSSKEIAKRIYRFTNFKLFKQSFRYIKFNNQERNNKNFWKIEKLEQALNLYSKDLNNCKIKTFYLHCPPYGILNNEYLEKFFNLLNKKNILPAISEPDTKDLDLLVKNFPNIKLQFSIESFWDSKDKIIKKIDNLSINSIFKKLKQDRISDINIENKFWKGFIKILDDNNSYKIVLGVNSYKSIEELKRITLNFNNIL